MFEEFDNSYPSKPEIVATKNSGSLQRRILTFVLMAIVIGFLLQDNIIVIASLILVVGIHELGHFLGMKIFGLNDAKVANFSFLQKLIKKPKEKISQKHFLITLLLGPIPGIVIGFILMTVGLNNEIYGLTTIATLFIGINLFSLLPIDPLGGGKILQGMFFPNNEKVSMYFVLVSSIILIFVGFFTSIYILMIFGFFMAFKVKSYQKNIAIHEELKEQNVDFYKTYNKLSDRDYWKMRSVFLNNNPKIKDLIPSGEVLWENEKLIIDQIRQILKTEIIKDASILFKIAVLFIIGCAIYFPLDLIFENIDKFQNYLNDVQV